MYNLKSAPALSHARGLDKCKKAIVTAPWLGFQSSGPANQKSPMGFADDDDGRGPNYKLFPGECD